MRENAIVLLFLSCFCDTVLMFPFDLTGKDENVTTTDWDQPDQEVASGDAGPRNIVNSIVYKTVKRYSCYFEAVSDAELLLYGSQAWTFPVQDVKLNLSYPSKSKEDNSGEFFRDHVVTGIDVVLYSSGTQSKAFIGSGGLLQKNISLTFLCENSTNLGYQFWIYGIRDSHRDLHPLHSTDIMC